MPNNIYQELAKHDRMVGTERKTKLAFRCLFWGESVEDGTWAKNPNSNKNLVEHEGGNGVDSPYISISTSPTSTLYWAMKGLSDIAVYDYDYIERNCIIADLRSGLPELGKVLSNFAKSSQEICVHRHIPKEAIVMVIPYSTVREMCLTDYDGKLPCGYLTWLTNLENYASRLDIWKENFSEVVKASQKLWTANRRNGNFLGVDF